jgi:branched-subunit amino acid transport protein
MVWGAPIMCAAILLLGRLLKFLVDMLRHPLFEPVLEFLPYAALAAGITLGILLVIHVIEVSKEGGHERHD